MTPLEIQIALHYYTATGDFRRGCVDHNFTAPAVQAAINRFVEAGLLMPAYERGIADQCWVRTDGLAVLVDAICSTPLPVKKWVMPERRSDAATK